MPINQLNDDGAVIGYKPDLQYKKDRTVASNNTDTARTNYSGSITYTDTLSGFKDNCPSQALTDIAYVTENLKKLVDKLAKAFKNGNWDKYNDISTLLSAVENNSNEYIQDFVDYHHGIITGSIVPELIQDIHDTQTRMDTLDKIIKELYYGDENISLDEAKEIDESYISKMESYEASDDKAKINYMAISYDSIISRSVSMYAFNINKKSITVADIVTKKDDTTVNSSKASLVQQLFNEVNEELDYRRASYNPEQSVEIMQKTLYNYYDKRKNLIDLYDLIDSSESIYLKRKVSDYQYQVDEAIKDINRAFVGNQIYLTEKSNLEQEKHYLLEIYAQLNYNS